MGLILSLRKLSTKRLLSGFFHDPSLHLLLLKLTLLFGLHHYSSRSSLGYACCQHRSELVDLACGKSARAARRGRTAALAQDLQATELRSRRPSVRRTGRQFLNAAIASLAEGSEARLIYSAKAKIEGAFRTVAPKFKRQLDRAVYCAHGHEGKLTRLGRCAHHGHWMACARESAWLSVIANPLAVAGASGVDDVLSEVVVEISLDVVVLAVSASRPIADEPLVPPDATRCWGAGGC